MDIIANHPWRKKIVNQFKSADLEKQPVNEDGSEWSIIESEILKIGTISHESVDIEDLQQKIVTLLYSETKDFRVLSHLLNTLQRSGKPESIILAIALLADYVESFWNIAYPQKNKFRLIQMVLERFNMVKHEFTTHSIEQEREEAKNQFQRLKQLWEKQHPQLSNEVDKLILSYNQNKAQSNTSTAQKTPTTVDKQASAESISTIPIETEVHLDQSNERAWRNTLLKVAEIESNRSLSNPISFQLRRHIAWSAINKPPYANAEQITDVPCPPMEKLRDYERESHTPTKELWLKVENTLSYTPFWFDGHALSAKIAQKLGYPDIADVIKQELVFFINRLQQCQTYKFSNGQPFMNEETTKWLFKNTYVHSGQEALDSQAVFTIFKEEGMQAAMTFLEHNSSNEIRSQFHAQKVAIQLMNEIGCTHLALQQLHNLRQQAMKYTINEWEPSFFEYCQDIEDQIKSKE